MILVTGGTGFIGKYLLQKLIRQEDPVRALVRNQSINRNSFPDDIAAKIDWVEGDILDVISLKEAMQGCDKVYHCAGLVSFLSKDKKLLHQINVTGTANVVNAALDNGSVKLLHVSSIAALGRTPTYNHINEKTKWQDSPLNSEYAISKYLAEMEVWRGIAEGLNAVIVNPSVVLGAGNWKHGTCKFFSDIYKGMPAYTEGVNGFVDVQDVIELMILLMNSDYNNERFILNGENVSYKDFLFSIADALEKKHPAIKVSGVLAEAAWRIFKIQSLFAGSKPLVTKETARISTQKFYYDNTKVKEAMDFQFTPIAQTVKWISEKLLSEMKQTTRS